MPGVGRRGGVLSMPLGGDTFKRRALLHREGRPFTTGICQRHDLSLTLTYFRALQIPLAGGREFTDQDQRRRHKVVIVNQTMALSWGRCEKSGWQADKYLAR